MKQRYNTPMHNLPIHKETMYNYLNDYNNLVCRFVSLPILLRLNELSIKFRPLTYKEMNDAGTGQIEAQRMFILLEKEEDETVRMKKTQQALKFITDINLL